MRNQDTIKRINQWARSNRLSFDKGAGSDRLICYVSVKRESFQIVIEDIFKNAVTINYWEIKTIDDEEFHGSWTGNIKQIECGLTTALQTVDSWVKRRSFLD
jgi:hypothetical protein